tara:strand:+ start:404 stop:571 length:168 start_codon:yes stop_codon:yes gene_type:complete
MILVKQLSTAEQKKAHFKYVLIDSVKKIFFTDGLGEKMYFDDKLRAEKFCKLING